MLRREPESGDWRESSSVSFPVWNPIESFETDSPPFEAFPLFLGKLGREENLFFRDKLPRLWNSHREAPGSMIEVVNVSEIYLGPDLIKTSG